MKSIKLLIVSLLFGVVFHQLNAQQTVGLFQNTEHAFDGYTLFTPIGSTNTYLINNCGELCHTWASAYLPGLSVYMLEDGNILRTGNLNNPSFARGGRGGIIEMINKDGNVVWDVTISSETECQHHDIEYMPNGNILAVAWDSYTHAEAAAEGRTVCGPTLWSEKIIEIKPDLINGGGTVIWEWKAWDHLVQDKNPVAGNYGSVAESPELINLNHVRIDPKGPDWLHINSIDYNEDLDQIILSVREFNEIWVIDHSTTTAEAAGHSGGLYGKGGDLLYRWGNPAAYNQGDSTDQMLFLQHDAKWIPEDFIDGDMIMIFNNQIGAPSGTEHSAINVINPPVDDNGDYIYTGTAYGPIEYHWTYEADQVTDFYARNISGASRLPYGNTLICEGTTGRFFEVDYDGNMVWEYINPVSEDGIIHQGDPATGNNSVRAERYARFFPGFDNYNLTPQGYIEPGSTFTCDLFIVSVAENEFDSGISIYPNPATYQLNIISNDEINIISIYNATGLLVKQYYPGQKEVSIDVSKYGNGLYFIQIFSEKGERIAKRMIKQ